MVCSMPEVFGRIKILVWFHCLGFIFQKCFSFFKSMSRRFGVFACTPKHRLSNYQSVSFLPSFPPSFTEAEVTIDIGMKGTRGRTVKEKGIIIIIMNT